MATLREQLAEPDAFVTVAELVTSRGLLSAESGRALQARSRELAANPRIDVFLWFLLRDEQRLGGWQSGLTTFESKRKPSFNAFRRAALG